MSNKIDTLKLITYYETGEISFEQIQEAYDSGEFDNGVLESYFGVKNEEDLYNNNVKDGIKEYENSKNESLKDATMSSGITIEELKDILKPYMTLFNDYQNKLQNPSVNVNEKDIDPVSKLYQAQIAAGKIK